MKFMCWNVVKYAVKDCIKSVSTRKTIASKKLTLVQLWKLQLLIEFPGHISDLSEDPLQLTTASLLIKIQKSIPLTATDPNNDPLTYTFATNYFGIIR